MTNVNAHYAACTLAHRCGIVWFCLRRKVAFRMTHVTWLCQMWRNFFHSFFTLHPMELWELPSAGYKIVCKPPYPAIRTSGRNFAAHVPVAERQRRGELRAVLHVLLLHRRLGAACCGAGLFVCIPGYCTVVAEGAPPWVVHVQWGGGNRFLGNERGQVRIFIFTECLLILGVEGNMGTDQLAEQGRLTHPNNSQPLPKRPRTEPQLEALGLVEMSSDKEEARGSGRSSECESICGMSSLSWDGGSGSGFSSEASGTRRSSSSSEGSDFSTNVSDTRRVKYTTVREGRDNQEHLHRA